jgi:hypothetical protein
VVYLDTFLEFFTAISIPVVPVYKIITNLWWLDSTQNYLCGGLLITQMITNVCGGLLTTDDHKPVVAC